MNNEQFLLTKLSEECAEIAQAAAKTIQFGRDSFNPEYPEKTNRLDLQAEICDLLAIVQMLDEECNFGFQFDVERIEAKKQKVRKYRNFSEQSGYVTLEKE